MDENTEPLLSRTGITSPLGDLVSELKTKVDLETFEAFRRICAQAGTDPAKALRNYAYKVVHKKTFDEFCFEASQRRRLLLLPEGQVEALNGASV